MAEHGPRIPSYPKGFLTVRLLVDGNRTAEAILNRLLEFEEVFQSCDNPQNLQLAIQGTVEEWSDLTGFSCRGIQNGMRFLESRKLIQRFVPSFIAGHSPHTRHLQTKLVSINRSKVNMEFIRKWERQLHSTPALPAMRVPAKPQRRVSK